MTDQPLPRADDARPFRFGGPPDEDVACVRVETVEDSPNREHVEVVLYMPRGRRGNGPRKRWVLFRHLSAEVSQANADALSDLLWHAREDGVRWAKRHGLPFGAPIPVMYGRDQFDSSFGADPESHPANVRPDSGNVARAELLRLADKFQLGMRPDADPPGVVYSHRNFGCVLVTYANPIDGLRRLRAALDSAGMLHAVAADAPIPQTMGLGCTCGEPTRAGTHRTSGPCYMPMPRPPMMPPIPPTPPPHITKGGGCCVLLFAIGAAVFGAWRLFA